MAFARICDKNCNYSGQKCEEFVLEKRDIIIKQKQEKPLEEDGGKAPGVRLPLWSYKSKLLTPKPKT